MWIKWNPVHYLNAVVYSTLIYASDWSTHSSNLFPQVKEPSRQQPQMVFTSTMPRSHSRTDSETWREQKEKRAALMVGILIGVFCPVLDPFFLNELITPAVLLPHSPPNMEECLASGWATPTPSSTRSFTQPSTRTIITLSEISSPDSAERYQESWPCHKCQFKPPLIIGKVWLSEFFKKHRFT